MSFVCHQCGKVHEGLSFAYAAEAPAHYYAVPESLRSHTAILLPEQCMIGEEDFFVRGCLEVPIIGGSDAFSWGVWVSLSEKNFERMAELAEVNGRESEPPYCGWLSTQLPFYPDTLLLKALVHTRPLGRRPFIELEPTEHPLAVEQRKGITIERARQLAEMLEHLNLPTRDRHDSHPKRLPWWRFFCK